MPDDGFPSFGEMLEGAFNDMDKLFKGFLNGTIPDESELFVNKIGKPQAMDQYRQQKAEEENTIEGEFKELD